MVGVAVQVISSGYDSLGICHVPDPVELGDLLLLDDSEFRVIDVVVIPNGDPIGALVKVEPLTLG